MSSRTPDFKEFMLLGKRLVLFPLLVLIGCAQFQTESQKSRPVSNLNQVSTSSFHSSLSEHQARELIKNAQKNPTQKEFLISDLFLKANSALSNDQFEIAGRLFEYLNQLLPNNEFVQKKLVISFIKMGEIEKAAPILEKVYARTGESRMGLILASVYSSLARDAEATAIYQNILKKEPGEEDACIFLGRALAVEKKDRQAIGLLSKCSKFNKGNGIFDFYIAKIHLDNSNISLAKKSLKESLKKQSDLSQSVAALGAIYEESGDFDQAILMYKKFLEKKENDPMILNRIVQTLFVRERFEEVIPYAEKLSDQQPENLNLKVKLGVLYTDVEKFNEAISIFKELLTYAPNSDKILYYLGAIYQETKNYEVSIDYFNQIPNSSPLYSDSSIQIANMLSSLALEDQNFKKKFLSHINKSIDEISSLRIEFSVIKAGYYEYQGMNKEAMDALMVVQNEEGFSNQHKFYLANLYEKQKRYQESTQLIMTIIDKEPLNAHAWNFIGYAILERGDELDEAYVYIKKALDLNPDDGYIRDSLGWYYFKKGQISKALKEIEFAAKKVPDDLEILKHLAIIHKQMKNFKKSFEYYQEAMRYAKYPFERKQIVSGLEELNNLRMPASQKNNK